MALYGAVRMGKQRKDGENKKEIYKILNIDTETRQKDTKLHIRKRNKNEGTENGGHKKSSKI